MMFMYSVLCFVPLYEGDCWVDLMRLFLGNHPRRGWVDSRPTIPLSNVVVGH